MLNNQERNLSVAGPVIEEIKGMLRAYEDWKVSWVRRTANVAAHRLAKAHVGDELCKVVKCATGLYFILEVVSDEIPEFHLKRKHQENIHSIRPSDQSHMSIYHTQKLVNFFLSHKKSCSASQKKIPVLGLVLNT
ncbi:hypothetical protein VPH35_138391 [Triticum aestivum]